MPWPVPFTTLLANYPSPVREPRDALYASLGWDDLVGNPAYENTCAIRMSLCLLRSGVGIPSGELKIWKGPHKGRRVKIRYDDMARFIESRFGAPDVLARPKRADLEARGDGVVAFFGLPGGYPGHVDLMDVTKTTYDLVYWRWSRTSGQCGSNCYFGSREVWHWPVA